MRLSLWELWSLSLALSAISIAIMLGLIVSRLLAERRNALLARERQRLTAMLLDPAGTAPVTEAGRFPKELLADVAIDMAQLVRGEEREQLVASASASGVADVLRKRLGSRRARVRATAAAGLAYFPDAFATDALEAALDDGNAEVRLTAAMALADSGRAPPPAILIDKLSLGTAENSMLIVTLLEKISEERPDDVKQLIRDPDTPPAVKAAAIDALATSADYSLVPLISELALSADPKSEELPRFLRALGTFRHPAGASAVGFWLDASNWWVRSAAAEAAGKIGVQHLAPALAGMLGDPDWWVRFRAGEALARLGPEGRRLLSKAGRASAEPARTAARLTLVEQGIAP